jgi:hypothetical protein
MDFLGKFIWYGGIGLEAAILLRSLWTSSYLRFPIFYTYMACVFASSVTLLTLDPNSEAYAKSFWYWNAVTILLGYGVLVEIMHRTLVDYPGADRLARFLAIAVFFGVVGGLLLSSALHYNPIAIANWTHHVNALERDLRIVQAVFLTITLAVAIHYRIALGRALAGLAFGFGFYVAVSVVSTALGYYYGKKFEPIAKELQPIGYLISLGIWLAALWQTVKVRSKPPNPQVEDDYRRVVAMTREKLREVRSRFMPLESR